MLASDPDPLLIAKGVKALLQLFSDGSALMDSASFPVCCSNVPRIFSAKLCSMCSAAGVRIV